MNRYEVTPLTETTYAEFREELDRIAAHPETLFLMVEDAEEVVIRSVLGTMETAGSAEPVEGLSEYEQHIVYRAVMHAAEDLPTRGVVAEVRLDRRRYAELIQLYGIDDCLAAFTVPDIPRVLSSAAGPDLLSVPAPNDVVGYLVIECDEE